MIRQFISAHARLITDLIIGIKKQKSILQEWCGMIPTWTREPHLSSVEEEKINSNRRRLEERKKQQYGTDSAALSL